MIVHLLKNDSRFLRPWLIAWTVVLIVGVIMIAGLRTPLGWDRGYWSFLQYAILLSMLVQMLFHAVLVIKIVQKENLQNSKSYWLTRPIKCGHLVVSKYVFWLLWIVLPQMLQAAVMGAIFPGGWAGASHAIGAMLLLTFILGQCSFLAGSLTKDSGQAFAVLIGVPFVFLLLGHIVLTAGRKLLPLDGIWYSISSIPYLEAIVLIFVAVLTVFAYWIHVQCPGRRWRHRLICAGVLVLMMLAGRLPTYEPLPESNIMRPEGATFDLGEIMFTRTDYPLPGSRSGHVDRTVELWREVSTGSDYGLKARYEWSSLPAGWIADIEALRSFDSEGRWLRARNDRNQNWSKQRTYSDAFVHSLFPEDIMAEGLRSGGGNKQLFSSPFVRVEDMRGNREFSTTFATRFYRSDKIRLPLDPAARMDLGATRLILDLDGIDGGSGDIVLWFSYLGSDALEHQLGNGLDEGYFVLRDPVSSRVAVGRRGGGNSSSALGLLTTGQFEITFSGLPSMVNAMDRLELYFLQQNLVGTYVETVSYQLPAEN